MATARFERETFFQASPADTSAAQVASGLAQTLSAFSNVSLKLTDAMIKERDAIIKTGVNASKIDANQIIQQGKDLYPNDVEAYTEFTTSGIKGLTSAMVKNQKAPFLTAIDENFKNTLTEVKAGQHQLAIDEGLVISAEYINEVTGRGANAAREGDTSGIKQARQELNDSLSPQLYSPEEISAAKVSFDREMTEQAVIGTALKIADTKGIITAFTDIQTFEEKGMKGVHPDEVSRIADLARGILNTRITTQNKQDVINDKRAKAWQKSNAEKLLVDASGSANTPQVQETVLGAAKEALRKREITFVQFKAIRDEINAPDGIDNLSAIDEIETAILDNKEKSVVDDIISLYRIHENLTAEKANELRMLNIKRSGLPSTPFELQTKQALDFLKLSLTGTTDLTGLDVEKGQRYARAFSEYKQRVAESLELGEKGKTPQEIASDILPRYLIAEGSVSPLAKTRYGDKETQQGLNEALAGAIKAAKSGVITETEFIREKALIDEARAIIAANELQTLGGK